MNGETPREWELRNVEELARSTRERLGPEMWFAIRYQTVGLACATLGSVAFFISIDKAAFGFMLAGFIVFANSMYWAWYIRRGLNRRWEKEMAARLFAEKRADAAFQKPDERLLGSNRTREVGDGTVSGEISRPMRSWGSDQD